MIKIHIDEEKGIQNISCGGTVENVVYDILYTIASIYNYILEKDKSTAECFKKLMTGSASEAFDFYDKVEVRGKFK